MWNQAFYLSSPRPQQPAVKVVRRWPYSLPLISHGVWPCQGAVIWHLAQAVQSAGMCLVDRQKDPAVRSPLYPIPFTANLTAARNKLPIWFFYTKWQNSPCLMIVWIYCAWKGKFSSHMPLRKQKPFLVLEHLLHSSRNGEDQNKVCDAIQRKYAWKRTVGLQNQNKDLDCYVLWLTSCPLWDCRSTVLKLKGSQTHQS